MSNELRNNTALVTLRISRFAPLEETQNSEDATKLVRKRHESPFARKKRSNPFAKVDSAQKEDSAAESSVPSMKRIQGKHWVQDYVLRVRSTDTILNCLLTIKRTIDPTLAFRYSCGHGVCGSDAANVNGMPTLLCSATIGANARPEANNNVQSRGFRKTGTASRENLAKSPILLQESKETAAQNNGSFGIIELAPLAGFAVQRDLICDLSPMIAQIKRLEPYLQAADVSVRNTEGRFKLIEFLQHPEELQKFELLSNCIMCGACEGICPIYAGGEAFMGPAALINAARFIYDSRDSETEHRLDLVDSSDGISACQSVRACSRQCPRGIDIGEEIWQLTTLVNERKNSQLILQFVCCCAPSVSDDLPKRLKRSARRQLGAETRSSWKSSGLPT